MGQLGIGFSRLGIETTFVDPEDPDNFRRAIRPNTRAVYGETLGNPLVNVFDIEAVARIAHEHGLPLIIDNTVASPYLCNPFAFGADIVVHSATKYLGGHGTTMAGVVVESGKFDWGSGLSRAQVPGDAGAQPGLPRRQVLRDLRRLRLHHEGPHGGQPHLRRRAVAAERLADPAGHRNAAPAHAGALPQRAAGGASSSATIRW